jgi:ankyrin repeat protein
MENILDKNPMDNEGKTPLHMSAEGGHLKICEYIMDHLQNKSPKDNDDWTPLHYAANAGHFDVCNAMTKIVDDKKSDLQ